MLSKVTTTIKAFSNASWLLALTSLFIGVVVTQSVTGTAGGLQEQKGTVETLQVAQDNNQEAIQSAQQKAEQLNAQTVDLISELRKESISEEEFVSRLVDQNVQFADVPSLVGFFETIEGISIEVVNGKIFWSLDFAVLTQKDAADGKELIVLYTPESTGYETIQVSDLLKDLQSQIDELVAAQSSYPPVGSIMGYVGDLSNLSEDWQVCDGQQVNNVLLPDVNANNYFMRFTDTLSDQSKVFNDTTAVNGLSVDSAGAHSHTYSHTNNGNVGITYYAAASDGGASANRGFFNSSTGLSGDHVHALQGDTETAPDHFLATCIVRVE